MGSSIKDIQLGKQSRMDIVSYSHGRLRIPIQQTLTITPKMSAGMVEEFDNDNPILTYRQYEGCDLAFEVLETDLPDLKAVLMDVDPAGTVIGYDESQLKRVNAFINYTGKNSTIVYMGDYIENLNLSASPVTGTLKDPMKVTRTFMGTRRVNVEAKQGGKCQIFYDRFYSGSAVFSTPDDVAFSSQVGTFRKTAATYVDSTGTTVPVLAVFKNGLKLDPTDDEYTIGGGGTTITMEETLATHDIVEVFYFSVS